MSRRAGTVLPGSSDPTDKKAGNMTKQVIIDGITHEVSDAVASTLSVIMLSPATKADAFEVEAEKLRQQAAWFDQVAYGIRCVNKTLEPAFLNDLGDVDLLGIAEMAEREFDTERAFARQAVAPTHGQPFLADHPGDVTCDECESFVAPGNSEAEGGVYGA